VIPRVRGHPAVAEVARVFDGQDVAVVPRTLLTDARWLPTPPRPDRASLDGTRYFLQWLFRGTEGALETRAIRTKGRTDGKKVECRFWRLGHLQNWGATVTSPGRTETCTSGWQHARTPPAAS
jgi:hypothetical protein